MVVIEEIRSENSGWLAVRDSKRDYAPLCPEVVRDLLFYLKACADESMKKRFEKILPAVNSKETRYIMKLVIDNSYNSRALIDKIENLTRAK